MTKAVPILMGEDIFFPPVDAAKPSGLVAIGGDLSPKRLIAAYGSGLFPWYSEGEPILWWSPDPRFVLLPQELHISRSLRKFLKKETYSCTLNKAFADVISSCATMPRHGQNGTWIVPEMQQAYTTLHSMGLAHSIEVWENGNLVGGLYGVALGRAFFGESMFHTRPQASKVAFVALVTMLQEQGFLVLDCQQETPHVKAFGARMIPRTEFLHILQQALDHSCS